MFDILLIFVSFFGHGLLFSSIIFGGNTLPQKRLNASSPTGGVVAAAATSEEKLKTCEESKIVTKTEDDILSEKTCEEDFLDEADKPTVFEKVHCVLRPAVEKPKRSSKSKNSKKKSGESGGKKKKQKNKSKNNHDVPSAENDEAPASDEKNKKKKKKKKSKSLFSKDGTKKQLGGKDSKEKMDAKEMKDSKTPSTAGNNNDTTDAKLKALKGKE